LPGGAVVVGMESTGAHAGAGLAAEYGHLTAGQAGALAGEAGAGLLVLTHFSSWYADVAPLREQAQAGAGATRVVAAADLDRYNFPRRRELRRRTSPGPGA